MTDEERKVFHKKYLKSKEFATVRNAVFDRDGHRCKFCNREGTTDNPLVCHHTTYAHLGLHDENEIADCITICAAEHRRLHQAKFNLNWFSIKHERNQAKSNSDLHGTS